MSKEVFQAKGNLMKSIQTFLEKFNRISFEEMPKFLLQAWEKYFAIQHAQPEDTNELFQKLLEDLQIINKELTEYINSPKNSSNAIAASNFNQEKEGPPQDSDFRQLVKEECGIKVCKEKNQNMEDTLLELLEVCLQKEFYCMHNDVDDLIESGTQIESDKVIKSSAKSLVPIPSEYEVTSDDESECDVPVKDESSPVFTTFSNPLFDCIDDFTCSDDESLSNEDVSIEDFKVYSNPLFDDEEINSDKINSHCFNAESDLIESLSNHDTLIDSSSKIDYLEEISAINSFSCPLENFHANTIVETLPSSTILVEDSDSLREEIDIFTGTDYLRPPSSESDDYNSEGDIYFLKELLGNDFISLSENESSNFDHQNDLSFPHPTSKPLDVEFFFDFEPN
nr:hypothetical protein [Tanacetum cinerariifolium]